MKPISLGLLVFALSLVGWVVSVVLAVLTGGAFKGVANFFGAVAFVSLPLTAIVALIARRRKRETRTP